MYAWSRSSWKLWKLKWIRHRRAFGFKIIWIFQNFMANAKKVSSLHTLDGSVVFLSVEKNIKIDMRCKFWILFDWVLIEHHRCLRLDSSSTTEQVSQHYRTASGNQLLYQQHPAMVIEFILCKNCSSEIYNIFVCNIYLTVYLHWPCFLVGNQPASNPAIWRSICTCTSTNIRSTARGSSETCTILPFLCTHKLMRCNHLPCPPTNLRPLPLRPRINRLHPPPTFPHLHRRPTSQHLHRSSDTTLKFRPLLHQRTVNANQYDPTISPVMTGR